MTYDGTDRRLRASRPRLSITDAGAGTGLWPCPGRGEHRCRPRSSGERRVGCGLNIAVDLWQTWAFEHALGEHDDGQVPGRVDQPGGAQPAVPAERAAVVDRLAEPPGAAVEEPR